MRKNEQIIRDRSGSCACLVMIMGDTLYIANVGDSRAILSM
jgi:protein phosphatase PTC2/3